MNCNLVVYTYFLFQAETQTMASVITMIKTLMAVIEGHGQESASETNY